MFCLRDIYNRLPKAWFDSEDAIVAEIEALKIEGYAMNEFEVLVSYPVKNFLDLL